MAFALAASAPPHLGEGMVSQMIRPTASDSKTELIIMAATGGAVASAWGGMPRRANNVATTPITVDMIKVIISPTERLRCSMVPRFISPSSLATRMWASLVAKVQHGWI